MMQIYGKSIKSVSLKCFCGQAENVSNGFLHLGYPTGCTHFHHVESLVGKCFG